MYPEYQITPEVSEKLKYRQYRAAALICFLCAVATIVVSLIWGDHVWSSHDDKLSLRVILLYISAILMVFCVIDFVCAIYHYTLWRKNGCPCLSDDNDGLFADWRSGERSPIKITFAIILCIIALMFSIII